MLCIKSKYLSPVFYSVFVGPQSATGWATPSETYLSQNSAHDFPTSQTLLALQLSCLDATWRKKSVPMHSLRRTNQEPGMVATKRFEWSSCVVPSSPPLDRGDTSG